MKVDYVCFDVSLYAHLTHSQSSEPDENQEASHSL